jgi:hypothetical protein
MRLPRLVAAVLWLTVAGLAIAGFAAFSPQAAPESTTTSTTTPVRGAATGEVMARALAEGIRSTPVVTAASESNETVVLDSLLSDRRVAAPPALITTTTAATTTTTSAPAVLSAGPSMAAPLTKEEARSIIALFFKPEDVDSALAIAECESTLFPDNVNPSSGASGLFQHLPKYWPERSAKAGWAGADIFDPYANTAVAAWLKYNDGGWSHWTCYRG